MQEQGKERRAKLRFPVQLPIVIEGATPAREIHGVVKNMSSSGLFFSAPDWLFDLSTFSFKMIFPADVTNEQSVRVRGQGTVSRLEQGMNGTMGVAAIIDSYVLG